MVAIVHKRAARSDSADVQCSLQNFSTVILSNWIIKKCATSIQTWSVISSKCWSSIKSGGRRMTLQSALNFIERCLIDIVLHVSKWIHSQTTKKVEKKNCGELLMGQVGRAVIHCAADDCTLHFQLWLVLADDAYACHRLSQMTRHECDKRKRTMLKG